MVVFGTVPQRRQVHVALCLLLMNQIHHPSLTVLGVCGGRARNHCSGTRCAVCWTRNRREPEGLRCVCILHLCMYRSEQTGVVRDQVTHRIAQVSIQSTGRGGRKGGQILASRLAATCRLIDC